MKNIIKHFAGAGLATVMLLSVGCNDDPTEVFIADLYQKAYITTGIAPADEYTYKGTYALGGVQMNGPKLEYVGPNLSTTLGTGYVFDIYLCTAYAAKNPVSGTLYVPENAEELVAQYNNRGDKEDGMKSPCHRARLKPVKSRLRRSKYRSMPKRTGLPENTCCQSAARSTRGRR